ERELDQRRMNQEARVAAQLAGDEVQRHDAVPRHEAAVYAGQDRPPLRGHVLEAFVLDPPVGVVKEAEQGAPVRRDVALVLAVWVETGDVAQPCRGPGAATTAPGRRQLC